MVLSGAVLTRRPHPPSLPLTLNNPTIGCTFVLGHLYYSISTAPCLVRGAMCQRLAVKNRCPDAGHLLIPNQEMLAEPATSGDLGMHAIRLTLSYKECHQMLRTTSATRVTWKTELRDRGKFPQQRTGEEVVLTSGKIRIPTILFFFFKFYWDLVDLQCCDSFWSTTKWFSYT